MNQKVENKAEWIEISEHKPRKYGYTDNNKNTPILLSGIPVLHENNATFIGKDHVKKKIKELDAK